MFVVEYRCGMVVVFKDFYDLFELIVFWIELLVFFVCGVVIMFCDYDDVIDGEFGCF